MTQTKENHLEFKAQLLKSSHAIVEDNSAGEEEPTNKIIVKINAPNNLKIPKSCIVSLQKYQHSRILIQTTVEYNNSENQDITIHANNLFFELYGNTFEHQDNINVKIVKPITLKQLVLQPIDHPMDHSVKSIDVRSAINRFSQGLITRDTYLRLHIDQESSKPIDFAVVDCQPVARGIVGENTTIIILHDPQSRVTDNINIKSNEPMLLSRFDKNSNKRTMKMKILSNSQVIECLQQNNQTINNIDELNTGLVSFNTLFKLNAFDGTWVKVIDTKTGKKRPIVLRCAENEIPYNLEEDVIYVPPIFAYNLLSNINMVVNLFLNKEPQLPDLTIGKDREVIIKTNPEHQPPAPSSQILISQLCDPNSFGAPPSQQSRTRQEFALRYFFSKCPRLVHEGDVFAVPSFYYPDDYENELEFDDQPLTDISLENGQDLTKWNERNEDFDTQCSRFDLSHSYVYFTVKSIKRAENSSELDTETFFGTDFGIAKYGTCNLLEQGVANFFIPPLHELYMSSDKAKEMHAARQLKGFSRVSEILDTLLSSTRGPLPTSLLLHGKRGSGKQTCVRAAAHFNGLSLLELNCFELVSSSDSQTEDHLHQIFQMASMCRPCIIFLRHFEALAQDEQSNQGQMKATKMRLVHAISRLLRQQQRPKSKNQGQLPLVLIASTDSIEDVAFQFRSLFTERLLLEAPDQEERCRILGSLLHHSLPHTRDLSLNHLAQHLGGASLQEMIVFVQQAASFALENIRDKSSDRELEIAEPLVNHDDFEAAIKLFHENTSDKLGAPKVPNISWKDIGGLENAKNEVLDTIQLPLEHPEVFRSGIKQRSGVLLYGPPGSGKTLLAKAVATECALNFLSVKGPELINMYIGESEKNVREVFQKAREARPCVIFFDELDALAPNRGVAGDSGGVMDRIVSQLLAELDGLQQSDGLFVIGATNRPDLIDSALLRPGRFDRLVYLGVSSTKEDQYKIVKALTRKFNLSNAANLQEIVDQCPMTFTGADFYALCSDALLNGILRRAEELEQELAKKNENASTKQSMTAYLESLDDESLKSVVVKEDFEKALKGTKSSVSEEDLQRYQSLLEKFQQPK